VSSERDRSSLPTLYGAPAHRPRRMGLPEAQRPLGPDDLPIECYRSAEDDALVAELFPRAYTGRPASAVAVAERPALTPAPTVIRNRPVLLRVLAGRLMRPRSY
jgi:hypothetical protein